MTLATDARGNELTAFLRTPETEPLAERPCPWRWSPSGTPAGSCWSTTASATPGNCPAA
ncbi:hypothetical protein ACFRI7_15505 [Streptomyces sp. NPDC056716]|uniref:hypothetical protein n=1 Tax=unclassified Streptomyces TaxID=2593676 RepID=UPI0036977F41